MEKTEGTGERIGAYRVVRRIATGGTSDVLLAKAEGPHGFERTVVLKLLLSQFRQDEDFTRMFAREASAYARLSNPAIVQLHDFFSAKAAPRGPGPAEDQLVMVLEYVDGPTLYRLRGMLKSVGQTLDDQSSFYVAMRIYEALAAAHAALGDGGAPAPVIHRDVNPANVLVSWDGDVKLADFGVAKVTGLTHQSAAGLIKGTYGYMAPEQVTGDPVTPKADVYGAAIILWELLTKRKAFQRGALPEVEVLRQMAEPRIPPLDTVRPDIDKTVREAVKNALDPVQAKRTITAADMVTILRGVVTPDSGRHRLHASLALVRHEPKMSGEIAAVAPGTPTAPRVAPRPNLSKPALPRAAPPVPTRRTAAAMPAQPAAPPPSPPPSPSPESIGPSAAFDSFVEPPELVATTGRPSERARLAPSLESSTPGMNVGQAIDEILRGVEIPKAPQNIVDEIAARRKHDADRETLTAEEIGNLPKAPPALSETLPIANGPTVGSDEVARADAPTVVPPPPQTARLPGTPDSDAFPAMDRTLALDTRPRTPPPPDQVPTAPPPGQGPQAAATTPRRGQRQPVSTAPPATRKKSKGPIVLLLGLLVLAIGAGLAGTVGVAQWKKTHPPSASVGIVATQAPKTAVTPPPPPPPRPASPPAVPSASASAAASTSAAPVASAAPSASSAPMAVIGIPEGTGVIRTTAAAPGRRIFVDDKVVGQTPDSATVKCGPHQVKVGSSGKVQTIDVPCGGEINLN